MTEYYEINSKYYNYISDILYFQEYDCKQELVYIYYNILKATDAIELKEFFTKKEIVNMLSYYNKENSILMQEVIKILDYQYILKIFEHLKINLKKAITCKYANYIIQLLISKINIDDLDILFKILHENIDQLINNKIGCRIYNKIIELKSQDKKIIELINIIISNTEIFIKREYSHYVILNIFYYYPEYKTKIINIIKSNYKELLNNFNSLNVIYDIINIDISDNYFQEYYKDFLLYLVSMFHSKMNKQISIKLRNLLRNKIKKNE